MKAYRVKDWARHYENNRTRAVRIMRWIPVPNKHDGEGIRQILDQSDGIVIYGCWHLILQVASKMPTRGLLVRGDGSPMTPDALAVRTGWRTAADFARALAFLASPQVAWLEEVGASDVTTTQEGAASAQEGAPSAHFSAPTGQDSTGQLHTHTAREGWLGMVDRIRQARPEYAGMREADILNAIRPAFGKADALSAAVAEWAADHANATKAYDSPLRSLRKMVEAVVEGAPAKPAARYRGKEVTA